MRDGGWASGGSMLAQKFNIVVELVEFDSAVLVIATS